MNTDGLSEIAESVREHLDAKHHAREQALRLSRDVVRLSANAIRSVHRKEFDPARDLLAKARDNLAEIASALAGHADILHAGYVNDAQKEFAEANTTLALIAGEPLPTPTDLKISGAAYLNGIGETIGELRRHLLDELRAGDLQRCEEALTSGLRRTSDAMRGSLERTRGDFTVAYSQRRLEDQLREFEKRQQS